MWVDARSGPALCARSQDHARQESQSLKEWGCGKQLQGVRCSVCPQDPWLSAAGLVAFALAFACFPPGAKRPTSCLVCAEAIACSAHA